MQGEGSLQIDYSGQRNYAAERAFVRRQTQRKLPARRMPHHRQAVQIKMESGMLLLNKAVGGLDVLERLRPPATVTVTVIAHAPVFDIEGGDARRSQRFAEVSGMGEVILRAPKAAVDVQQSGVRPLRQRQTHLKKLIRVGAIGYALVRLRLRLGEHVFGGHRSLPAPL
jgi:hypothetical protein